MITSSRKLVKAQDKISRLFFFFLRVYLAASSGKESQSRVMKWRRIYWVSFSKSRREKERERLTDWK